jgi:hypothetical protein
MPDFSTYIDIDPYEYVEECSRQELQELIGILKQGDLWEETKTDNMNILDMEWNEVIKKLANSRLQLSTEDEDIIKQIANKL